MIKVSSVEDVKIKLEWACLVHKSLPRVAAPRTNISVLGFLIPSHLWSSDADDYKEEFSNREIDEHWEMFEGSKSWFKPLDKKEQLIVLLKCSGCGVKTVEYICEKNGFRVKRTTIWRIFSNSLLKIYAKVK